MRQLNISPVVAIMLVCCRFSPSWADPAEPAVVAAVTNSAEEEARLALQAVEFWRASRENTVDAAVASDDVSAQQALPSLGIEKLYAIPLLPLSKTPKPPTAFVPFNQAKRWTFLRGTGYLFFVKYTSDTPVGTYQESFYMPGRFRPNGCNAFRNTSALSTQRMWADSQAALQASRSRGFPTELATFTWTNITRPGGSAAESIVMRVGKAVALNVTFTLSSPAMPSWVFTPAAQADLNDPQLLWPLMNATTSPATAVPILVRSPVAVVLTVASANTIVSKIDSRLLTGVAGLTVANVPDAPALMYWNGSASVAPATALAC